MTGAAGGGWSVERRVDTARALLTPWPAPTHRRSRVVSLCTVEGPDALVLGSTQTLDVVDRGRAAHEGVDVVRRSSGGGAVWVGPGAQVWLDAWIPRGDPLWHDDVIASSWWLGETWVKALDELGVAPLLVHRGRALRTEWSDIVCFAGIGPGEVTKGPAKVVGIAQRRTRDGARLHSMAMLSWHPTALLSLLALGADDSRRGPGADDVLSSVATGISDILPTRSLHRDGAMIVATVEDALLSTLP